MFHFSFKNLLLVAGITSIVLNSSCSNNKSTETKTVATPMQAGASRIAYVNLDSLQEKYTYWKSQTEALAAEQTKLEAEIQSAAQKLQNDYIALQKKAQAGTLTETEGNAAQQRLGQAQQQLESHRASMSEQFQKKQIEFSERLQKNIDEFLAIYNKDNKYDFILSYSKAGQILYANKALDITEDVLKGLNEYKPAEQDSKASK